MNSQIERATNGSGDLPNDALAPKKYPFKAVVFTSEVSRHSLPDVEYGSFAIDLDTLIVAKNPCIVDYNHDDSDVIGSAKISIEDHEIVAVGDLVSVRPNDRAASIAAIGRDVPYGISPTLDLEAAKRVDVAAGATYYANGREYVGPLYIYQNAALLGISVCPYPTDERTSFTPLKKGRLATMTAKFEVDLPDSQTINDPTDVQPAEVGDVGGTNETKTVKNEELQEFINAFGLERGVLYYQEGLTMDEAVQSAYADVKQENEELKQKLSRFEADDEDEERQQGAETLNNDENAESDADETKLGRCLKRIEQRISKFEATLAAEAKARRRGDAIGLSASRTALKKPASYRDAFKTAVAPRTGGTR